MKKIEMYQCNFCGATYKQKEECEACEKKHVMPVKFVGSKWMPPEFSKNGIPESICIEMENGEPYWYTMRSF